MRSGRLTKLCNASLVAGCALSPVAALPVGLSGPGRPAPPLADSCEGGRQQIHADILRSVARTLRPSLANLSLISSAPPPSISTIAFSTPGKLSPPVPIGPTTPPYPAYRLSLSISPPPPESFVPAPVPAPALVAAPLAECECECEAFAEAVLAA